MKRVHYLAGVVGLAPAAFGLAVGPAAHAADKAVPAPQQDAKTVSLHHVLRPGAAAATATSSSSGVASVTSSNYPAASPSTTGCTTSLSANIAKYENLKGHFWFTDYGCLGTVKARMHYNKNISKCVAASVFSGSSPHLHLGGKTACGAGTKGHSLVFNLGFHRTFTPPFLVCLFSTYHQTTPWSKCARVS
jgi:hypothetical protein